eukprot:SAG31_NODE_2438_length_5695_cov_2.851501_2_plen_1345_part_00
MSRHVVLPKGAAGDSKRRLTMVLLWAVALCCLGHSEASCTITDVMRVNDIVASCCEGQPGGNCAAGFPPTCSYGCAVVLVPYWRECSAMVNTLGDETFPTFVVSQLTDYVQPCQQTLALYGHGAASSTCSHQNLEAQVEAINSACCEQNQEYVCRDGPPDECDAECALAFIPFWMDCIVTDEELHDIANIREFQQLHQICSEHMSDADTAILYSEVVAMADNEACEIDTSPIISQTDAKAPQVACETDTVLTSMCEQFIHAGTLSCEDDMCPLCGQRHTCDHTCGFPCDPDTVADGRRLSEITYTAFHHGLDAVVEAARTCPLDQFGPAAAQVSEACCYEHSRAGMRCGLSMFSMLENRGCVAEPANEGVTWRYYSEDPTTLEACAAACCEADDCVGFEHPHDDHYCKLWTDVTACTSAVAIDDGGLDTHLLLSRPLSFVSGSYTWHEAVEECEARGLVLARVDSAAEFDQAMMVAPHALSRGDGDAASAFWIGLHDTEIEGDWHWMDGGELHHMRWAPGQPDDRTEHDENGEDCASVVTSTKQWNDMGCNRTLPGLLCEQAPDPVEETCPEGLPQSCSFDCGRVYTQFMDKCGSLLDVFIADDALPTEHEQFEGLRRQCTQMDPTTMVMALFNSECDSNELCGDGRLQMGEECDDGVANVEITSQSSGRQAYDAATAESNAPVNNTHVGHFGAGFVDYTASSDQYVTFTVTVPTDADYLMEVGYALPSTDRPLQLSVNGLVIAAAAQDGYDDDGLIHFPSSDSWTDYRLTQDIPMTLNAGQNAITLTAVGSSGANIDGIYIVTDVAHRGVRLTSGEYIDHAFIETHLGQCTVGCHVVSESILRAPPSPPAPPPIVPDGAIAVSTNGEQIESEITHGAGGSTFQFEAIAGHTYNLQVHLRGTLADSVMDLARSDGTQITSNDDSDVSQASRITWTAVEDGVYLVVVRGFGDATGTFALSIMDAGLEVSSACREIRCGGGAGRCTEVGTRTQHCAYPSEQYVARCCADSAVEGFDHICTGIVDSIYSEVGAVGDGWSVTEATEAMPDRPGTAGKVHGPFGNDVTEVTMDVSIPRGVHGETDRLCEITWTSWSIDSRDGETDRLLVNGDVVWEKVAHHSCDGWEHGPSDFVQHYGDGEDICMVMESVEVQCPAGEELHLQFTSEIDESEDNEAWAFSDVHVHPYGRQDRLETVMQFDTQCMEEAEDNMDLLFEALNNAECPEDLNTGEGIGGAACYEIRCGRGENECNEQPRCAEPLEENEVACCADSGVAGFRHVCDEYPVWGERDTHGMACNHAADYAEAREYCRAMGGRLCTADEIDAGCTQGTGCGHDADLVWTSTPGTLGT